MKRNSLKWTPPPGLPRHANLQNQGSRNKQKKRKKNRKRKVTVKRMKWTNYISGMLAVSQALCQCLLHSVSLYCFVPIWNKGVLYCLLLWLLHNRHSSKRLPRKSSGRRLIKDDMTRPCLSATGLFELTRRLSLFNLTYLLLLGKNAAYFCAVCVVLYKRRNSESDRSQSTKPGKVNKPRAS